MALNITAAQYAVAKGYADAGNYQAGWNYLALDKRKGSPISRSESSE